MCGAQGTVYCIVSFSLEFSGPLVANLLSPPMLYAGTLLTVESAPAAFCGQCHLNKYIFNSNNNNNNNNNWMVVNVGRIHLLPQVVTRWPFILFLTSC